MEHNTFDASDFVATPPAGQEPPQLGGTPSPRRDCIRLRGLPLEAQVFTIVKFLGEHALDAVFEGVHMIYNADGRPSGGAFVQMDSEDSAFSAALHRHGRYIMGRSGPCHIEVFQCSREDIRNMGAVPWERPLLGLPNVLQPPQPPPPPPNDLPGEPGVPVLRPPATTLPPLTSPTASLTGAHSPNQSTAPVYLNMRAHTTLLRGLSYNATVHDVLALFPGIPELTTDCVDIQRGAFGLPTGEALITFPGHMALERIVEALHRHNISVEVLSA